MKNKFTKLLILLGIIFLLGILKDVFTADKSPSSSYEILKIHEMEEEKKVDSLDYSRRDPVSVSAEHKKVLQMIEEPLSSLIEEPSAMGRIKKKIEERAEVFFEEDSQSYIPCKIK